MERHTEQMKTNSVCYQTISYSMLLLILCSSTCNSGTIMSWNSFGIVESPEGTDYVKIDGGEKHSLALKSDGSIVAWGVDNYGLVSGTPSENGFIGISAGYWHNLALTSDGYIVAWGKSTNIENTPTNNGYTSLAVGKTHSLSLRSDGSLFSWGDDNFGVVSNTPTGNDFIAVDACYDHSLALKQDGSIIAWGDNSDGIVTGIPTSSTPFTSIAAGYHHALALTEEGTVIAWGGNYGGGQIIFEDSVAIAAGDGFSLALKNDGSIDSIGEIQSIDGIGYSEISAGRHHAIAIIPGPSLLVLDPNGGESLTSGKAYPIRWSSTGVISNILIEYSTDNGSSWTTVSPPNMGNNGLYNWLVPAIDSNQCLVRVSDASDPNISDTSGDVFAIEQPVSGSIEAWGYNAQGQCEAPVGNDFIEIAGGGYFSLALKADGSLAGWGQNSSGQLFVPVGNDFVNVSAGVAHGLALKSDGSLAGWGRNVDGQNNVPTDTCFVSISAGGHHNLAIKNDGSVIAWGQNNYGQCEVPESNDFVSISGGYLHSLGLKADGSIAAWGNNDEGQCNVLAGSDFAAIAGGGWHSVAIKSDGSLEAWGLNDYDQCDVPEGNDFVAIGAGDYHCFALKADGTIVAWGRNAYGERDVPDGNNFVAVAAGSFHGLAIVEPLIGGYIDWTDLRLFVERWLDEGCSDVNDWCGRADINRSTVVDSVDYSWLAKYWGSVAPEPNAAGHPEPGDSSTEVSVTADLSWTTGDDTAAHGVYFGINPTPDVNEFQGYQTATIFDPGTMAADTTYYWQVDEVGLGGETAGEVWSFTTSPVPGKAYNPSPSDSATDVSINANLSWTANFYTTSHDVYFGTSPTPGAGEFEGNQTSTTFEPGTLDYDTTYYWRIDSVGPGGTTTGVIWSFTTEAPPVPGKAGNPIPADMATDVGITTCLSWEAGANTESHDVYFGTNPTPGVNDFQGNQATTTFCPPKSLEYNTTYYWRIDEKNPYDTTTGDVWSFTTMQDPNLVGWWKFDETSGVIAYDSSGNGNHGQLVDGLGNGLVWVPGEGALDFDGSNNLSRVVVSTVGMSTTEGAIGFWVKLAEPQNRGDGRNGSGYFFGCDNGVKDRILLYMDNSNTELDVRIGDHSETNIITLGTLVWYHIALTWDSGSYVVYLNGIVMSAGVYDGLTTFPSTADIGNNGGSSKQSFHGLMGDLQVYDKSISPSDIQELYEDVIY